MYPKDESSVFAAEGTKAHALGELKAALFFGKVTQEEHDHRYRQWLTMDPLLEEEDLLDMHRHTDAYVALIAERKALYPHSQVLLEERVQTGVPRCWGTSDTIIVSPYHVEIIDLKYGMGIPVSAVGNPQLRLYGVGALNEYGDVLGDTEVVRWTVFQPRLESTSTEEMTADEIRAWRDSLLPIAEEALGPDAHFGPSDTACRWCPAAGECRARVEYMTARDFSTPPDLLTAEELGDLLGRVSGIKSWCEDVTTTGLRKAYSEGLPIPGWKVVISGGIRVIGNQTAAITRFGRAGFSADDVTTTKLKGLGDLEKLIKAKTTGPKKDATLESVLGSLVGRTAGKPALARDDDRRESINPDTEATKEFRPA